MARERARDELITTTRELSSERHFFILLSLLDVVSVRAVRRRFIKIRQDRQMSAAGMGVTPRSGKVANHTPAAGPWSAVESSPLLHTCINPGLCESTQQAHTRGGSRWKSGEIWFMRW